MIKRLLDLTYYNNSLFLLGPRQTGKTFLIKHTLEPDLYINLLKREELFRYTRDVSLLSKETKTIIRKEGRIQVVIDEIQRCPELLNEVHLLIEDLPNAQFILTGSSARKLRRAGVNLLGGRALTLHLYPFTHEELGDSFLLDEALRFGTMPRIALARTKMEKVRLLKGYVDTYLKEEIQQEAVTRNIPAFSGFLELAAFENGNLLNLKNLSREVGVSAKTIKEYFQILEDTLVGFFLFPYKKSHRERLVAHPKFYFFDRGMVSALKSELGSELLSGTPPYGNAFEHWFLLELRSLISYREREARLSFFRTSDGAEVDIILELSNQVWAIEIKSGDAPDLSDVKGLRSFIKDHQYHRAICACQTPRAYKIDKIEFLPWKEILVQI